MPEVNNSGSAANAQAAILVDAVSDVLFFVIFMNRNPFLNGPFQAWPSTPRIS
jgi:hypothetical protein